MKFMVTKWNSFCKWMDYNPPYALSSTGWRLFKAEFEERAPIRFFIMKKIPKVFRPMQWKYKAVKDWVGYRLIDRYHVINTGLKPGWHEFDERLLHASFNMLKDFVEIEQASMFQACNYKKYPYTWKEKIPLYFRIFYRKPELGLAHLEWEASLDDPSLPIHEQSPAQAKAAREILELYRWWVDKRPARKYNNDLTYDCQGFDLGPLDDDFDKNAEDYKAYQERSKEMGKITELWAKEDDEMLERLVKLRRSLWT